MASKMYTCLSCGEEFAGGIKAVKKHICKSKVPETASIADITLNTQKWQIKCPECDKTLLEVQGSRWLYNILAGTLYCGTGCKKIVTPDVKYIYTIDEFTK